MESIFYKAEKLALFLSQLMAQLFTTPEFQIDFQNAFSQAPSVSDE